MSRSIVCEQTANGIESADVDRPSLTYRTAFHVTMPREVPEADREPIVRALLEEWLEAHEVRVG